MDGDLPAAGWDNPGFDDSVWARSAGGFDSASILEHYPYAKVATEWETPEIWLRRHFTCAKPKGELLRVIVTMFHDEGSEVYLNGSLILSVREFNKNWTPFSIPVAKFNDAVKEGDNVIAVKVIQTIGDQHIDLDLSVVSAKMIKGK
ncbi:MAG: hypothetical protein J6Z49_01885 [Kiritimatiellae bacterium]|nr:hypothetical protein [Kiritimatiellia bacterium]